MPDIFGLKSVVSLVGAIVASGALYGAISWFNGVQETKVALAQAQVANAQMEASRALEARNQGLEAKYADKHVELVEQTLARIDKVRAEAQITITRGELSDRAATLAGREDLRRRAAERTEQIYDEIERLSDWGSVYTDPDLRVLANP